MAAPTREGIVGLVAPVVERAGLDLEDVVVTPAGKRRMVRVVVDGDDGVDLDRRRVDQPRGRRGARRRPT